MTETWRYCGNQIKLWRMHAGVSREELGKEANYEYESVKSMEQGRRRPTARLLQVADEMCGAGGKLLAAQEYLKPDPFPARAQEFMAIESEAIARHSYDALLIPGLLQTEEYARALISESHPPLDDETVEERVRARMQRQGALTLKTGTVFSFVLYEASLRTMVGGKEVMLRQLERVLDVGKLRNVSIQVLPQGRCNGLSLNGSMVLMETTDHDRYAYVEAPETSALHSDPVRVSALAEAHGMIRMQALSVEESAEFIRQGVEEL
ncbi:helix-turn-helix transcriptional regulator [Streptomyces sp. NBC_01142]|uniref:helix-turn-helix domain-containing protein n=1 Tax=Streptomyces sp. NBC_01142 TaxID=2975865 RepID=UPI002252347A|nr:helix-turn-helix transcriptional regulator [Streptomyces sp. NBC_01142]MCX4819011.1 helix-turn-helix transcriptional regulator [Streptomyces sp. NBC_01142]